MKYGKDLISRGASTTRTPAIPAVNFANLRGKVRIKSVCAMAKIAGTKNGRVSATRRFKAACRAYSAIFCARDLCHCTDRLDSHLAAQIGKVNRGDGWCARGGSAA